MNTFGPAYSESLDGDRLRKQHERIREFMLDCQWHTLGEISRSLDYPESSVSAQLRHLRKPRFGGFRVDKQRHRQSGLWKYRVTLPVGQLTIA